MQSQVGAPCATVALEGRSANLLGVASGSVWRLSIEGQSNFRGFMDFMKLCENFCMCIFMGKES